MFGCQCDIVCAESDPAFGFDESQLQNVPDSATVVRTNPNAYRLSRIPRKVSVPDHLASWIPGAVVTALNLERKTTLQRFGQPLLPGELTCGCPRTSHSYRL